MLDAYPSRVFDERTIGYLLPFGGVVVVVGAERCARCSAIPEVVVALGPTSWGGREDDGALGNLFGCCSRNVVVNRYT